MSLQVLNQLRVNGAKGFSVLLAIYKVESKTATSRSLCIAFPRWQTVQSIPGTDLKVPQPVRFSRAQLVEMARWADPGVSSSKFEAEVKNAAAENIMKFFNHFGLTADETEETMTLEKNDAGEGIAVTGVKSARTAIQFLLKELNSHADGRILDPEEFMFRALGTARPLYEMEMTSAEINETLQALISRREKDTERLQEAGERLAATPAKVRLYFSSLVAKNGVDASGFVQWRSPKETTSATVGDAFALLDEEVLTINEDLEQDS